MTYQECLKRAFAANATGVKYGLANMQAMLDAIGSPERAIPAIHVAGTNGKGTTCTKIARALIKEGYKVGLFTSPHISSYCERITINGVMIEEEAVTRHLNRLFEIADAKGLFITFFEYTTLLAHLYFKEQNVDFVVLETGLGGRLDATNICNPVLTVITSISLDHTSILGDSLEKIAYEKAGIMKQSVPCVVGPSVPRHIVREVAKTLSCPLYFSAQSGDDFEEENCLVAKMALDVLSSRIAIKTSSIDFGLQQLPPCRFERIYQETLRRFHSGLLPKEVILDVAHNPDGIRKLFSRIDEPVTVLCGFSKDKDVKGCLAEITKANALFFVKSESSRALKTSELLRCVPSQDIPYFAYDDIQKGLQAAFAYAGNRGETLVICGTFYIMDDARKFLVPSH